jgi:raffinose/stachyose/melibiose transport system substrate-binding protein
MGDKDMYVMQFGLYQLAASEVYPKNPAYDDQLRTGETKFTDTETWDKVMSMYTTLYDNGYISSTSLGVSAQQAIQMFIDGQAAMTFDGSFNVNALRAAGAAPVELGYFPLPGTADTYAAIAPGACLAIYSGSQNKDTSKMILDYWLDGDSDLWRAYADNGRNILTYGYGADKVDPLFKPFMDLYSQGKAFYWCNQAWPAGTETEMETKLSEYIGGQGTSVQDIVSAMQFKFEDLLAQE